MTKNELLDLEYYLAKIQESNDKIDDLESLYFWAVNLYRCHGKKKLGDEFRDDL
jgi:hypothetical protein